ncbi:MAG: glycosyltransferase family A protein [Acidimicrobiales bacterium]
MPRVTVVMATYNWSAVLPFSMASALEQTFTDLELLVIGDGCTDDSADVVGAVAATDDRVRWIDLQPGVGHQYGPNNEGICRARGDLIAYLGHDDLWLPDHLATLVDAADRGHRFTHAVTLLVSPHDPPSRHPAPGQRFEPGHWIAPTSVLHDRALGVDAGGWPAPDAHRTDDPEAALWRALHARSPLHRVDRITSIKLPAADRRNVYRERPFREQAYWLQRVRDAEDPGQDLVATIGRPYELATPRPPERPVAVARRGLDDLRRLGRRMIGRPDVSGARRIAERQRFKGVPRARVRGPAWSATSRRRP